MSDEKSLTVVLIAHHSSLITYHFLQMALDLFGLRAGQVACAEADAVVSLRDGQHLWLADGLGEFERRLVGAAADPAAAERRRHPLVEFDDRRRGPLIPALRAAPETERPPSAQEEQQSH